MSFLIFAVTVKNPLIGSAVKEMLPVVLEVNTTYSIVHLPKNASLIFDQGEGKLYMKKVKAYDSDKSYWKAKISLYTNNAAKYVDKKKVRDPAILTLTFVSSISFA